MKDNKNKLVRDTANAWISGVCAGLADHLQLDLTLVRIGVILLSFTVPFTPVVYVIMSFMLPAKALASGQSDNTRMWIVWLMLLFILIPIILFAAFFTFILSAFFWA
jgi:phage shock protein PspC (stress-responsive transcriptional regulator)